MNQQLESIKSMLADLHRHVQNASLSTISAKLDQVLKNQEKQMADLDQILSDVQAGNSLIDGISALVDGLRAQLADALSGTKVPAQVQSKIDEVFDAVEAQKARLAQAVTSNTPAATVDPNASGADQNPQATGPETVGTTNPPSAAIDASGSGVNPNDPNNPVNQPGPVPTDAGGGTSDGNSSPAA